MSKQVALLLLLALPAAASIGGFQVASGTLVTGNPTGTGSVTGLSFTPKAVLLWYNGQIGDNATAGGVNAAAIGWGVGISSSNRACVYYRRAGNITTSTITHTNAAIATVTDNTGAATFIADLVSMNSDGFTVNTTTSAGVDFFLHWMAFGGSEFRANLVQFNSPVTAISQAFTGMGFKPDALIVFSAGSTATIPNADLNGRPGFGFVDSSLNQAAFGNKQVSGVNTSRRAQSTAQAIYIPDLYRWLAATATSLDADGATFNYTTVQGSAIRLWALGLSGIRSFVGPITQNTSTGNQSIVAVERTPTALLMGSFCRAAVAAQQNDGVLSFGGATASAQSNNAFATASGGNATGQAIYSTNILTCLTAGTPTIDSQASLTGFTARGFDLNNGTADATARQLIYMALSPLPVNRMLLTRLFHIPQW